MSFEENIKKNNIVLPNAADPVGAYVAAKIVNNLLYISGDAQRSAKAHTDGPGGWDTGLFPTKLSWRRAPGARLDAICVSLKFRNS